MQNNINTILNIAIAITASGLLAGLHLLAR